MDPLLRLPVATLLCAVPLASSAPAQVQAWAEQFGSNGGDGVRAMAPDGSGGVYLFGDTVGSVGGPNAGMSDVFLARYDEAGNRLWILQTGTGFTDYGVAAAPDGAGGVFVGGETRGGLGGTHWGAFDAWLAHYDGAGNQTWILQFGTSSSEGITALASDGAGGVFACGGGGTGTGGLDHDAWVAHYDGQGVGSWTHYFSSSGRENVWAAHSDGMGGVLVGGDTSGDLGAPVGSLLDGWVARVDAMGIRTWLHQFSTGTADGCLAVVSDGAGGGYFGGATYGSLGGPHAGGWDAWVARYDSAGNRSWIRQLGTSDSDQVFSMAPRESGGLYLCGETVGDLASANTGGSDVWISTVDSDGSQISAQQFGGSQFETPYAAAADGQGGLFVGGNTLGVLFGPTAGGYDAWVARFEGPLAVRYCTPAAANSTGRPASLYASGSSRVGTNELTLAAADLPQGSFGCFLASETQGLTVGVGSGQGTLCLGGSIGRFLGPGQVMGADAAGRIEITVDLLALPQPLGSAVATPGQTWNFQAWYRDANPGPTSNLTDALAVQLR